MNAAQYQNLSIKVAMPLREAVPEGMTIILKKNGKVSMIDTTGGMGFSREEPTEYANEISCAILLTGGTHNSLGSMQWLDRLTYKPIGVAIREASPEVVEVYHWHA